MKLIAKTNLNFTSTEKPGLARVKAVRAGAVFECDEDQANKLIKNKQAVEKPKATRRVAESTTPVGAVLA